MSKLENYNYRAARALVLLHEKHLRKWVQVWKEAKAAGVTLPETDNMDYESIETLLQHVLEAARDYIVWICDKLGLHEPGIEPPPGPARVEAEVDIYLEHLLERWRLTLVEVKKERMIEEYKSNWGETFSIVSMLEHAVMHPIRHEFQLKELMKKQS